MNARTSIAVVVLASVVPGCHGAARTPQSAHTTPSAPSAEPSAAVRLARGRERLELSAYREAEKDFRALGGTAQAAEGALGLGQVLVLTGRYAEALSTLKQLLSQPNWAETAAIWSSRAERNQGDLHAAEATLRSVANDANARAAKLELGDVLINQGRRADAEPFLMSLVNDYNEDRVKESDGVGLTLVGRAAQLLRSPRDANDAYNAAERVLPGDTQTLLFRADLFLEKYDPGHAEEVLNEILAKAPREPQALILLARVKLAQALDFDEAERLARLALSINPKLGSAYAILVGIALRDQDLDLAAQRISEGLAQNPGNLELLSLRAAERFLADDPAGVEAAKAAVFSVNPQFSQLYSIVSEFADWEHRYDEIVRMMKAAVALDSEDGVAYGELGLNLIRAGDDANGVAALTRAFALDPYNVRVFNTLNLYDRTIPREYVTVEHPPFRIRYRKDERDILDRYVPPLLDKAWAHMVKAYGFTPETPIGVELYAERENFGVRTGGLPETAIQGVCFGRTLAAMSPKNESFNLGMTLWHELSHVFHIQLSKSHVPRWFTEGLAEYETIIARPEWAREQDPDLYQALRANRLPAVANMTRAFTRAEELNDVATAYYASSQILVSWAESYGMPKLDEMLRSWGKGERTSQVLQTTLGKPPEQLDREFREFAEKKLVRYTTQFVPNTRSGPLPFAEEATKREPSSARAHTTLALALTHVGHAEQAKAELARALALDPKFADARFLDAEMTAHEDPPHAVAALRGLIADGHDGYSVEMLLAQTLGANDEANAVAALRAATRLDPTQAAPEYALADFADKKGDLPGELEALRVLAQLEQHEPRVYQRLLRHLIENGSYEEAVKVGEAAIYADVEGLETHLLFAQALNETHQRERAQFELESAVLCDGKPEDQAEAHARLAESYLAGGQRREAAKQAKLARALDPKNPRLGKLPN